MRTTCTTSALALVLLLAVVSAAASAPSGLRGLVTRSPITPVCTQGVSCSAPAKNSGLVFFREASTARTRTDARGRYRIALAPGWWSVRTAAATRIGRGISPSRVRVVVGRFRVLNFDIDTGIR
jgi:hypothetical protein